VAVIMSEEWDDADEGVDRMDRNVDKLERGVVAADDGAEGWELVDPWLTAGESVTIAVTLAVPKAALPGGCPFVTPASEALAGRSEG